MLATIPLGLVLRLPLCDRLPLHIARGVSAPAFQRCHMIDHVAGAPTSGLASGRAGVGTLEFVLGSGATLNPAVRISPDAGMERITRGNMIARVGGGRAGCAAIMGVNHGPILASVLTHVNAFGFALLRACQPRGRVPP